MKNLWRNKIFLSLALSLAVFVLFGLLTNTCKAFTEDDLKYYLPFDETASLFYDTIGDNTKYFEISGSATSSASGIFNRSVGFNGGFIASNGADARWSLPYESDWALSFWIKTTNTYDAQKILDFGSGQLISWYHDSLNYCAYGGMCWYVDLTIDDGEWHNLIIQGTGAPAEANGVPDFYLDGFPISITTWGSGTWANRNSDESPVIGRTYGSADAYLSTGTEIDDWAVFTKILTTEEYGALQTTAVGNYSTGNLEITSQIFSPINQDLMLRGTCDKNGSGIYQMTIFAATSSEAAIACGRSCDPNGPERGQLVSCQDVPIWGGGTYTGFIAHYDGSGLTGTSTIYIDDTFYGTQIVSVDQNFSATTTQDEWTGSVGYMSEDDPEYSATNAACSPEEWETPDPIFDFGFATTSVSIFNTTKIKCIIMKQIYIFFFGTRKLAKDAVESGGEALKNFFPFSIPANIIASWNESASSSMPADLEWLQITDEAGNINIALPGEWLDTSTDFMIPVWGPSVFTPTGTPQADLFGHIKETTKYVNWLALLALFIFIGNEFYNEIQYEKTKKKHNDHDYQYDQFK